MGYFFSQPTLKFFVFYLFLETGGWVWTKTVNNCFFGLHKKLGGSLVSRGEVDCDQVSQYRESWSHTRKLGHIQHQVSLYANKFFEDYSLGKLQLNLWVAIYEVTYFVEA